MKLTNGEETRVLAILKWVVHLMVQYHFWKYHKHLQYIVSLDINEFMVSGKDGHRVLNVKGLNKAMKRVVYNGGAVMLLTQNDTISTRRYLAENGVDTSLISLWAVLCGAILEVWLGNLHYTFNIAPEKSLRQVAEGMDNVRDALVQFAGSKGIWVNTRHHPFDVPGWQPNLNVALGVEPNKHGISIDARVFNGDRADADATAYLLRCLEKVAMRTIDERGVLLRLNEDSGAGSRYMTMFSTAARKVAFMRYFRAVCNMYGVRVIHGGDGREDAAVREAGVFVAAPEGTYAARNGADMILGVPGDAARLLLMFAVEQDWGPHQYIRKSMR